MLVTKWVAVVRGERKTANTKHAVVNVIVVVGVGVDYKASSNFACCLITNSTTICAGYTCYQYEM
jgi:hypothetical protein